MTLSDLEDKIRKHKSGKDSIDGLVILAKAMYRDGMVPGEDNNLKKKRLARVYGDRLDTSIGTCLSHLLDIDIIHRWTNGPEFLIIHARRDEVVNGENLDDLVDEEIERVIEDMHSDDPSEEGDVSAVADGGEKRTIRDVLSEEFEVDSKDVERELHVGETTDRMKKLGDAVEAIEDDPAVKKDDYDDIFFIRNPYQYELTERAVDLAEA